MKMKMNEKAHTAENKLEQKQIYQPLLFYVTAMLDYVITLHLKG